MKLSRVLEKLIGAKLVKNCPTFCVTQRFNTVFIRTPTYPYPGPDESSPHLPNLFSKIHFNITLFSVNLIYIDSKYSMFQISYPFSVA